MSSNGVIKPEFFGLHVSNNCAFWPNGLKVGSWRTWDCVPSWYLQQPTKAGPVNFGDTAAIHAFTGKNRSTDAAVDIAFAQGASILYTLGNTPGWASLSKIIGSAIVGPDNPTNQSSGYTTGTNAPPRDLQDWINYVTTVGTHFKNKVFYYEIWNEINGTSFFTGTMGGINDMSSPGTVGYGPGSDMYNMVKAASIALKAIDPRIKIVAPNVTSDGLSYQKVMPLYKDLYDGGYIDVVGVHFYSSCGIANPTWSQNTPENTTNGQIVQMPSFRKLLTASGLPPDFPIWNTELGWCYTNADGTVYPGFDSSGVLPEGDVQCGTVMRSFILAAAAGIDRQFWYGFDHGQMGMIEPTSTGVTATRDSVVYKSCVGALWLLQKWLVGRYVSNVQRLPGGMMMVSVTDDDGFDGIIVWNHSNVQTTFYIPNAGNINVNGPQYTHYQTWGSSNRVFPADGFEYNTTDPGTKPWPLDILTLDFKSPNPMSFTEGNVALPVGQHNDGIYVQSKNPLNYRMVFTGGGGTPPRSAANNLAGYGVVTKSLLQPSVTQLTLSSTPVLIW